MPYRPAFTKQSCKTAQRIERCPDKVRFEKVIPTAGVVGWGKEAEFLSTGGNNAFSEIVRHARFMEGHLHWSLAVTVVSCSTVFLWYSSLRSLLVGARFHLPVRDLMPKRAERPEERGFMHRPLRRLARFEQRSRWLFRGRARSHRDGAGFELTLNLWERVHPRRGPQGQSRLQLDFNKAQAPARHSAPAHSRVNPLPQGRHRT